MKILTPNFYKTLLGFATIVFVSLVIISVTGILDRSSDNVQAELIEETEN